MKIFLLEDDYSLNEAIKEIIQLENHSVENFYDGETAFSKISNDFDLYISFYYLYYGILHPFL